MSDVWSIPPQKQYSDVDNILSPTSLPRELSNSLRRLNSLDSYEELLENAQHLSLDIQSLDLVDEVPPERLAQVQEDEPFPFDDDEPFHNLEVTGSNKFEVPLVHISALSFSAAVEAINSELDEHYDDPHYHRNKPAVHLPPTVEVLLRGVAHTFGFEDCLTVEPDETSELEEDTVATTLTLPAVCEAFRVQHIPSRGLHSVHSSALAIINEHQLEDTFCMVDLATIKALYDHIVTSMPRVRPHFAVKCLPDRGIISTLAALGAGFDCASTGEVELVLGLGVPANRIILAHPVKRPVDLRCIVEHGIQLTTFDSESELHKMKAAGLDKVPGFEVVLRIRADDPTAKMSFGTKYGCSMKTVPRLLEVAKVLGLAIAGVSFHVGSGSMSPHAYDDAITQAKAIFLMAVEYGHKMPTLLDIGGGFTSAFIGTNGAVSEYPSNFSSVSAAIDRIFPSAEWPALRCISEPGRYFAGSSVTIAAMVYGKREGEDSNQEERNFDYWITDGVYGNFNGIIYDWAHPEAFPLRAAGGGLEEEDDEDILEPNRKHKSTIFGPTCDSVDVIMKAAYMPELQNGDWLLFPDSGAYSLAGACDFNGIAASTCRTFYIWADRMEVTANDKLRERALIRADKPALNLQKL